MFSDIHYRGIHDKRLEKGFSYNPTRIATPSDTYKYVKLIYPQGHREGHRNIDAIETSLSTDLEIAKKSGLEIKTVTLSRTDNEEDKLRQEVDPLKLNHIIFKDGSSVLLLEESIYHRANTVKTGVVR